MKPEDLQLLMSSVLGPAKETIREGLTELDQTPLGHVAFELFRAKLRGDVSSVDDIVAVLHEATKPKP